jgi:hypothetical protein
MLVVGYGYVPDWLIKKRANETLKVFGKLWQDFLYKLIA